MEALGFLLVLISAASTVTGQNNTTATTIVATTLTTSTTTLTTSTTTLTTSTTTLTTSTTSLTTTTTTPTTTVPTPTTTTAPMTTTTAPTTNTAPTTSAPASLNCLNGGSPSSVACLCPDLYSGNLCQFKNSCEKTTLNGLTFPSAAFGLFSYSDEKCSPGTANAGISKGSTRCSNGTFGPVQVLECGLTLDDIKNKLSSPTQREKLAFSAQIITSTPQRLSTENVSAAVQISTTLLSQEDITENTRLAAVTTVSQILNTSVQQLSSTTSAERQNLTQALEAFSVNQISDKPNSVSSLVQPNLAVQSVKITPSSATQVQFSAFKGLEDTFLANRINVTTSTSQDPNLQPPVDIQMNIKLKEGSATRAEGAADVGVNFVLYNNDQFFPSKLFQASAGSQRRVISGKLRDPSILDAVEFKMSSNGPSATLPYDFACVFWNYSVGDWSTNGCIKVTTNLNSSVFGCHCGHTTSFAVLMTYSPDYQYLKGLDTISLVGCVLSVLGLVITAVFQIATRKSRGSSPTLLLVSICLSLTVFYLLFIFGISNPDKHSVPKAPSGENSVPNTDLHLEGDRGPCTIFTALLHYFLLASFTWSTLYAAQVFFLIKNAISGPPRHFATFSVVTGWGFPAAIVGVSLGTLYRPDKPLNYRQEEFCWLAAFDFQHRLDVRKPLVWGFLLPLALMLLFNFAVLIYFSYITCRKNPSLNRSNVTPLRKKMLSSFSLAVVLGLSWIIGYLMLFRRDVVLVYAFCLCNTTQGLQIFFLFTVRTTFFKQNVVAPLKAIPPPEIGIHKKCYTLWQGRDKVSPESYRSTDFDQADCDGNL